MDEIEKFRLQVEENISNLRNDRDVHALSRIWIREIARHKYAYNFTWMGRPLIQFPQDMVAVQELIWDVRPDLIIETGIAHGGSLVMNASFLAMLDYCDAAASGVSLDPRAPARRVVGIDVDIRDHNRRAIEAHPMSNRIEMLRGSSIAPDIINRVRKITAGCQTVLVLLDSHHTHAHVLAELHAYAPLVSVGSYCVVFDTLIEQLPDHLNDDRPWGVNDNPMTAVDSFLESLSDRPTKGVDGRRLRFEVNDSIDSKLLISAAPRGYLRRIEP